MGRPERVSAEDNQKFWSFTRGTNITLAIASWSERLTSNDNVERPIEPCWGTGRKSSTQFIALLSFLSKLEQLPNAGGEMSWTCPHSGETFELGMCDGGRRVFNDKLREREVAAEAEAEKAVAGMRVGAAARVEAADSAAEALGATTLSGEAAPASSAEIHIDSGSGPRVIALHNDGGAQRLLVAGQLTPPVTNGCEVEFLGSRKKMTKEKAKKRIAEAKQQLQTKRKKATQAEHVGTIVSLLSDRS